MSVLVPMCSSQLVGPVGHAAFKVPEGRMMTPASCGPSFSLQLATASCSEQGRRSYQEDAFVHVPVLLQPDAQANNPAGTEFLLAGVFDGKDSWAGRGEVGQVRWRGRLG